MSNYLIHHGINGQKWGVRRYENSDGTLTAEGKERYTGRYHYDIDWSKYKKSDSENKSTSTKHLIKSTLKYAGRSIANGAKTFDTALEAKKKVSRQWYVPKAFKDKGIFDMQYQKKYLPKVKVGIDRQKLIKDQFMQEAGNTIDSKIKAYEAFVNEFNKQFAKRFNVEQEFKQAAALYEKQIKNGEMSYNEAATKAANAAIYSDDDKKRG